ncbi:MAG TPA: ATP-binding cassette domain-containing protein [Flavisolibacter sp.]|jgi:ABC-2 type transport system ATP-binding protein|nr:ATP-binding cassette domain-containing protein [Flavisolibacter sp.]
MNPILSIEELTKYYGKIRALNNVSFEVPDKCVFGILGPNGSGKTTLLGIVMDILKPTSGSFKFFGSTPDQNTRKKIGTLLETPNFYHYLSGERNLIIAAEIKGKGKNQIEDVLKKVNLFDRKHSKFSTYSLGMKQRLAIAACLLGDPEVLVFDEPTNGLDPVGIAEIRDLIKLLAKEGKTIIMASHLLDEVEKVCTHVAILKKGNVLTAGNVDEVLINEDIIELSASDLNKLETILNGMNGYTQIKKTDMAFQLFYPSGTSRPEEINQYCFNNGIVLSQIQIKKKSLETKFFELTK